MENIEAVFAKFDEEYLEFDRIETKLNNRPDLHAFLLLDSLFPGKRDMICSASYDEIWLDVDEDAMKASAITEGQIRDLVRCGVRFDEGCLCMFA